MKKLANRFAGFSTYWDSSRAEAKKAGRSRMSVLRDMLHYRFKYGFSALDYQVFGFAHNRNKIVRLSYFSALDWANANYFLNMPEDAQFDFFNKIDIYDKFGKYYQRDVIISSRSTDEEIKAFVEKHPLHFAKQAINYGGFGLEKINYENFSSFEDYKAYLVEHKYEVLEELIKQHPDVNKLYPYSVNSLRVTTVLGLDGTVHFLPSILRMGGDMMEIDNVSSGGVYVQVDPTGRISSHGFKEDGEFNLDGGHLVEAHTTTGTVFLNYQLPHTKEAFELVEKMAKEVPEYRYIGWDIALTEDGVDMIELNTYASYDMIQCYYQNKSRRGNYEQMVKLTGIDYRSLTDRQKKVRTYVEKQKKGDE